MGRLTFSKHGKAKITIELMMQNMKSQNQNQSRERAGDRGGEGGREGREGGGEREELQSIIPCQFYV